MCSLLAFENVYIVSLKRLYACIDSFDSSLDGLHTVYNIYKLLCNAVSRDCMLQTLYTKRNAMCSLLAFEIVYIVKYFTLRTQHAMCSLLAVENVYIVSLKRLYACIDSFDSSLQRFCARLV